MILQKLKDNFLNFDTSYLKLNQNILNKFLLIR